MKISTMQTINVDLTEFGISQADFVDWKSYNRILGYVRVSSLKQEEKGNSIAFQSAVLEDSIRGIENGIDRWTLFAPEVGSAYRMKRPILNQLLREYTPDDVIIVWHLDRLIRPFPLTENDFASGLKKLHWIRARSIHVVTLIDPYMPLKELQGLRAKLGMQYAKLSNPDLIQGRHTYSNEAVSDIIESMIKLGCSYRDIAKILNWKKLPTQTKVKWDEKLVWNYRKSNHILN